MFNEYDATDFVSILLGCGTADVSYILRKANENEIDLYDVIDYLKDSYEEMPDANKIIAELQRVYAERADSEITEDNSKLENGTHYSTYVNCIDSHVSTDDEQEKNIRKLYGKKKAEKIIEHLNAW